MELPRASNSVKLSGTTLARARCLLQAVLLVAVLAGAVRQVAPLCGTRPAASTAPLASGDAGLAAAQYQQQLSASAVAWMPANPHPPPAAAVDGAVVQQEGQQLPAAPPLPPPDWPPPALLPNGDTACAARVSDASSWGPSSDTGRAGDAAPFAFPRIIHQTVEDKSKLSCEVLAAMQSWVDMNPGYAHVLWDGVERRALVDAHYHELLPLYDALSTNVERADLWRYLALHRYGGVYVDSDVTCTAPIASWNAGPRHDADGLLGVVYAERNGSVTRVNNFALAFMPCHPLMASMPLMVARRVALAGLAGKPVRGEVGAALSEGVIGRTGPAALTAAVAEYAAARRAAWPANATEGAAGAGAGSVVGRLRLLPREVLTMGWETASEKLTCAEALERHPGAYVCHQYFGTWKAKYDHRPALTYDKHRCRYWGVEATGPRGDAAVAAAAREADRAAAAAAYLQARLNHPGFFVDMESFDSISADGSGEAVHPQGVLLLQSREPQVPVPAPLSQPQGSGSSSGSSIGSSGGDQDGDDWWHEAGWQGHSSQGSSGWQQPLPPS